MNALEPPYGTRDSGGMAARIAGQPEQIEAALERLAAAPWRLPAREPSLLAVGGLGGSAIAADLTAGLYHDRLAHPLITVRDYHWPAFVNEGALALLCSYSGETEETLSLYRAAGGAGAARAAITSGGTLASWCERDAVPCMRIPGGSPPRAALFSAWAPLTALLHALGWVDDPAPAWREAAALLRARNATLAPERPAGSNPAKQLAEALVGRSVTIYAGSERTGPVATRLRQQLNENAKMPAHSAFVPELNHNEIVGWERSGGTSGTAAVVLLRDAEDSAATRTRLTLTGEYAARQGAAVHSVESSGGGRLARLASLVQFGDYVSLYLALARGVDPTPIASIDEFKRRLAEAAKAPGAEAGAKRGG
ncbi:MAG: bifunctional phosphoglucose/phosphomannose isomerase [Candidatus Eisenbacteria bacterium]|nr:bifunctional phosphoglucose/phosphomannose isomerase [Candidatus Eisenbacteria bacterium]